MLLDECRRFSDVAEEVLLVRVSDVAEEVLLDECDLLAVVDDA